MKLLSGPTSPFARKCRIVAIEKSIQLEEINTNPFESEELPLLNPLKMIPVLILDDSSKIFDSDVICQYLDEQGTGRKLFPDENRWGVLTRSTVGNGLSDASVQLQLQKVLSEADQSAPFMAKMKQRIDRSFSSLQNQLSEFNNDSFYIDTICIVAGISHVELRHGKSWRDSNSELAEWYLKQIKRQSIHDTMPQA